MLYSTHCFGALGSGIRASLINCDEATTLLKCEVVATHNFEHQRIGCCIPCDAGVYRLRTRPGFVSLHVLRVYLACFAFVYVGPGGRSNWTNKRSGWRTLEPRCKGGAPLNYVA